MAYAIALLRKLVSVRTVEKSIQEGLRLTSPRLTGAFKQLKERQQSITDGCHEKESFA